jgi:hypothetical protein
VLESLLSGKDEAEILGSRLELEHEHEHDNEHDLGGGDEDLTGHGRFKLDAGARMTGFPQVPVPP